MRAYQRYGLNQWAAELVKGEPLPYKDVVTRYYLNEGGGREDFVQKGVISTVKSEEYQIFDTGWYGGEDGLFKYTMPDGTIYREKIQDWRHSSGPCAFMLLEQEVIDDSVFGGMKWDIVSESVWTDEEMDKA